MDGILGCKFTHKSTVSSTFSGNADVNLEMLSVKIWKYSCIHLIKAKQQQKIIGIKTKKIKLHTASVIYLRVGRCIRVEKEITAAYFGESVPAGMHQFASRGRCEGPAK